MIGMTPGPHVRYQLRRAQYPWLPDPRGRPLLPSISASWGAAAPTPALLTESVAGGALGVKIHEDFGASPAVIDGSLIGRRPQRFRRPSPHRHDQRIRVLRGHHGGGRGPHHPHVPRRRRRRRPCAGPAQGELLGQRHPVLDQSNQSFHGTCAGGRRADDDARAHHESTTCPKTSLSPRPASVAQTMAAEDFLHDMGAISCFGTDTQGMGRLAENVAKCWQLASVMKERVGRLAEETTRSADNERIKRYVAKLHDKSGHRGRHRRPCRFASARPLADIVLWPRASFGVKPWMVIKSGYVAWSAMGDGNASQIGSEPILQKPMWGSLGTAKHHLGVTFVSRLAIEAGTHARARRRQAVCSDQERPIASKIRHGAQFRVAKDRSRSADL